jgi:hypothetical protein
MIIIKPSGATGLAKATNPAPVSRELVPLINKAVFNVNIENCLKINK